MEQKNVEEDFARSIGVAKYTAISSLTGALLTAAYESTRSHKTHTHDTVPSGDTPAFSLRPKRLPVLVSFAALNSGIVGLAFFSTREYLVTPLLRSAQATDSSKSSVSKPLTWWNMRMHHVLDTLISSSLLGGTFNALKRGRAGIFPGAFTASLVCTSLQFAVNETKVARVKYVSKSLQPATPLESQDQTGTSSAWSSMLLSLIGLRKLSDEEYVEALKRDKTIKDMEMLRGEKIAKDTVTRQ